MSAKISHRLVKNYCILVLICLHFCGIFKALHSDHVHEKRSWPDDPYVGQCHVFS